MKVKLIRRASDKMNNLKVIKSIEQYHKYCNELEELTSRRKLTAEHEEKIDLLTVLIEKWDKDHYKSEDTHPVELLKQLMEMHDLNAATLSKNTGLDKTVLSKIINNKKGFSKEVIRILANYFKVNQEAFNKPYTIGEPEQNKSNTYSKELKQRSAL